MQPSQNPYEPPPNVETANSSEAGRLPPGRKRDWFWTASILLVIAVALTPGVLCCGPAALLVGALGIVVGINVYHRSDDQAAKILAIVIATISGLAVVTAIVSAVTLPFRNL